MLFFIYSWLKKGLGWEQPEAKCGARQPSGLLENQGKLPFSGGNQQEYEKSTAVLLWGYIPNICPCSFISTGINVISSSVIQILPWKSDFAPRIVEMNLDFISIGFT